MQLDRTVSIGNIISWVVLVVGLGMGYGKLASSTAQNTKDVSEARDLALKVQESLRELDNARAIQINSLAVTAAETKITISYVDRKLDELINESRTRVNPNRTAR